MVPAAKFLPNVSEGISKYTIIGVIPHGDENVSLYVCFFFQKKENFIVVLSKLWLGKLNTII